MRKIRRYLLGPALLGGIALAAAGAGYLYWSSQQPVLSGSDSFVVQPGTGVNQIASALVSEQILEEPYTFTLWAHIKEYTTRLHAGEYFVPADITVAELLNLFVSGKVIQRSVTLIEGWTFLQFRDALRNAAKLRFETEHMTGEQIMTRLGVSGEEPEGRFFPDTYLYTADMSDLDVLARAHRTMESVLDEEWSNRDPAIRIKDKDQALVLASIIEKETGRPEERRPISAVFHNRLKKGMRLQTDPTVIYGLGDSFDGNLTRAHLQSDTPYNTYTRAGLPPTPIAMPGRASIHAALNPEPSEALYFVSRGDGSHEFSNTLEEHNGAVRKYQLKRSDSGGSDGRDLAEDRSERQEDDQTE
jgi:UPF0755 protein